MNELLLMIELVKISEGDPERSESSKRLAREILAEMSATMYHRVMALAAVQLTV